MGWPESYLTERTFVGHGRPNDSVARAARLRVRSGRHSRRLANRLHSGLAAELLPMVLEGRLPFGGVAVRVHEGILDEVAVDRQSRPGHRSPSSVR